MFSYLHGMRPNSRRSAIPPATNPPPASPSRFHHENTGISPSIDSDASPSRQRISQEQSSAGSAAPPLLPPITRITSSSSVSGVQKESQQGHWSFKGTLTHPNGFAPPGSMIPIPRETEGSPPSVAHADELVAHPNIPPPQLLSEDSRPEHGRRKRPIDIRFEQMRSYSEPPFQHSVYTQQDHVTAIPQPFNQSLPPPAHPPPPPPPKATVSFTPDSQVSYQPISLKDPPPPPKRPAESRYHTWNSRVFDRTHAQASLQAAASSEATQQSSSSDQHRNSKKKRGILQAPFDLLAKRRSQSAAEAAYAESQNSPALQLPDDYDPRIRGKVVHDFSAPRPDRSIHSKHGQEAVPGPQTENQRGHRTSWNHRPNSAEREHTPVFKEHFDDGLEKSQDPAIRSPAYMQQMAIQASQSQPDPSQLPAFARKLPSTFSTSNDQGSKAPPTQPSAPLGVLVESPDKDQTIALPSPSMSPPRAGSTTASISEKTAQGLGSPKRYMSNSSRFSFDLTGVGSSAQEKLLEEKHRQNAQRKQRQSTLSDEDLDDEERDIDYDDMDGDYLEERIPGVNCDEDDAVNQTAMPVLQREMESFNFVSPNKSSFESTTSLLSTGVTSLDTPKDLPGQPAPAASESLPSLVRPPSGAAMAPVDKSKVPRPRSTPGESFRTGQESQTLQREVVSESNLAGLPQHETYLDDDMYFDDGMIDDMGEISDQDFDEDVFDDIGHGLYGLPLRDRTLKPLRDPERGLSSEYQHDTSEETPLQNSTQGTEMRMKLSPHRSLSGGALPAELQDGVSEPSQPKRTEFSETAGLTQDNLAAYNNNALSFAVNQAAMNGAFDRTLSLQSLPKPHANSDAPRENVEQEDDYMTNDSHDPHNFDDDYGDDGMDDDAIVAAANAEALENDADGFYGQEFGFYARASGSNDAEYANGGYFGPRALETLHRSHSGKANFQEPSLTPITERSEWSNRNSAISLVMHGYPLSAVSATSPQFTDVPLDDVNMQLAMLKQLRRGAWGGSDASLPSSSNSQHSGSPLTHLPPGVMFPSPLQASNSSVNIQNLASSLHSFSSSNGHVSSNDSDPSPSVDSPTVTFAPPIILPPQPAAPPPPVPDAVHEASSSARSGGKAKKGHGRKDSGAESVSYKEEGGKWVIEKRRLSKTGEEMLGRSIVEGGRI